MGKEITRICCGGVRTPGPCPKADACPDCHPDVRLAPEYGFCQYGLGAFDRCLGCFRVFNFREDKG